MSDVRLQKITNAVYGQIEDCFEEGDGGELLLTSPINEMQTYDIYSGSSNPGGPDDEWFVVINDEVCQDGHDHLASLDTAKHLIAGLIARDVVAAEATFNKAKAAGLIPA